MADFNEQLKVLVDQYIDSLGDKLKTLDEHYTRTATDHNHENLDELYRSVHSISGSGATFGLDELSLSAKKLEHKIKSVIDIPDISDATIKVFCDEFRELRNCINHIISMQTGHISPAPSNLATVDERLGVNESIRILVADKDKSLRDYLGLQIRSLGHEVLFAENGEQAYETFRNEAPDLVLMGVVMEKMNGHQAARKMKANAGSRFRPVIFITSLDDDQDMVECINAGGDDFLVKPVNPLILQAKIKIMQRIRKLHSSLEEYMARTEEELIFTKHVFENITDRNKAMDDGIHSWSVPTGHFSGDLIAYNFRTKDKFSVMLGDLTGHGLTAAIGALPSTDIFYTMIDRGFTIDTIAQEINKKLKQVMPTGRFLAAAFIEIDFYTKKISIINCSMPPVLLFNYNNEIVHTVESDKLALGIIGDEGFDSEPTVIDLDDIQSIFTYSDGVTEVLNSNNEMFGDERLAEVLTGSESVSDHCDRLASHLDAFYRGKTPTDDITFVSVIVDEIRKYTL